MHKVPIWLLERIRDNLKKLSIQVDLQTIDDEDVLEAELLVKILEKDFYIG
jgi:hypothetical protein